MTSTSTDASTGTVDVAALTRHYTCPDCEVAWHGTDPVCWSCERNVSVLGAITCGKDAVRMGPPDDSATARPENHLTSHGPRVEAVRRGQAAAQTAA